MNAAGLKPCPESRGSVSYFLEAIDSPETGVQIWIANLDSILPNDMSELMTLLDPAERARAAQFYFERDRRRFVASRGILRQLLGAALDIPAAELAFEYGQHGKPAIASADSSQQTLRFNISHAAGSAIFALVWDREIGIDLEGVARLTGNSERLSELAARILSPRELEIWRSLPNDVARRTAFLRAWTRKEAYLKGTGEGLFSGLQTIEIALDAAVPQPSLLMRDWILHDLPAPAGFAAAVAVKL